MVWRWEMGGRRMGDEGFDRLKKRLKAESDGSAILARVGSALV